VLWWIAPFLAGALALSAYGGVTRASDSVPRYTSVTRPSDSVPARVGPTRVRVSVPWPAPTIAVPRSFFGLSLEYPDLPQYDHELPVFESVLSQLHANWGGPLVLRIGGSSADQTYFEPASTPVPAGAFRLTPSWFAGAATLVRALDLHLILDLNLFADSPAMAADVAGAALHWLPAKSVVGFEIGNEPDHFYHGSYSIDDYVTQFNAYANALHKVAPRVPLLGPSVSSTSLDFYWLVRVSAALRSRLAVLTGHRYPLSACGRRRHSREYPTIGRLLGAEASSLMAKSVLPAVTLAHRAGLPFSVDEFNSVTCGGLPGVSNSFATALWAPDALFELLHTGLNAVHLHFRVGTINTPFAITPAGLTAYPLLYGLILFVRTIEPGGRVVGVRTESRGPAIVKAWAVHTQGNQLHVLLINKSAYPAKVDLRLPSSGPLTVERLLAPAVTATSGVTLGGQQLGADAHWAGTRTMQNVERSASGYELSVPAYSAALAIANLPSNAREIR
jgi:Glycosyl hydrolase family 79 C-terminal beta domain